MEQLKGLYFFLMSEGAYSDYGVNALYVSDKPVTEEDWHRFCEEEFEVRDKKRRELWPLYFDYSRQRDMSHWEKQREEYYEWKNERGSYEEMFVKAYNLVKVDYQELWLDY